MRIRLVIFFAIVILMPLAFATALNADDTNYRVGVARVDITPNYRVRLNGFGSRREEAEGKSQTLWAKAIAISQGEAQPVVLVAIDNLGIRQPMVDQVALELNNKYGLPRENFVLTFTHTHCAPKVNGASDTIFSSPIPTDHQLHIDRYTDELPRHLLKVACDAIDNRKPATLDWQVGKVTFAMNRRTPGGPVDHDLPVLMVRDEKGKPFAIYTSYACHCVTLSFNMYSGDWAGYAQELIEAAFPGTISLVSIGCGSDSNPSSGVANDRVALAQAQGQEIANEVKRLFEVPGRKIVGAPRAVLNRIPLDLNPLPTREELEAQVKSGGSVGYNASWQIAKLDRGEDLVSKLDYPIQSLIFGNDLQIVFLAGEICADYSLRLKKELKAEHLWINGYANDFCAYIPSERLLREGGYGGGGEVPYFALPTTLKAGLEQQIMDAVTAQIHEPFRAPSKTQGVPPRNPEESMSLMSTHPEFRIELVAAEPLVTDPVAIDFGIDGRLWVAEMPDYSRSVDEEFVGSGRIRFLTDDDRDGRYDRSTTFVDGLRFPTDVKAWSDGVLICDAPNILYAVDKTGDGRADDIEVIVSGFATHNPHARVNGLRFCLDGWLHGSGGLFGGMLKNKLGQETEAQNRDFRFNPATNEIESALGQTQQGLAKDDFDNWFGCTNSSLLLHYPLDDRYTRLRSDLAPPPTIVEVPSAEHGQRLIPPRDLVLFKLTGPPGRPTSACGLEIYRDQVMGADYYGDAFVCEPVHQMVHRLKLTRDADGRIVGNRAANEMHKEFLISRDQWFRPVQARMGPDGALYIVDMYRFVIEHPKWIPETSKEGLDLFAGHDLGRIYRVVPKDFALRQQVDFAALPTEKVVNLIGSKNGAVRDLAQHVVVGRDDGRKYVSVLENIVASSTWPAARIQALATAIQLGHTSPQMFRNALSHTNRETQRAVIRIAEKQLAKSAELQQVLIEKIEQPAPEVLTQLVFSFATANSGTAGNILTNIEQYPRNSWIDYAMLSSISARQAAAMWQRIRKGELPQSTEQFELELLRLAANDTDSWHDVSESILQEQPTVANWQDVAKPLAETLRATPEKMVIREELAHRFSTTVSEAIKALATPGIDHETQLVALDLATAALTCKSVALKIPFTPEISDKYLLLLTSAFPPELQNAALGSWAKISSRLPTGTDKEPAFWQAWEHGSPQLRRQIIDSLLTREEWTEFLLREIIADNCKPGELDASQRERILSSNVPRIAELARTVFEKSATSNASENLSAWASSLTIPGRLEAGKGVFSKHCSACHVLDGTGHSVGPDLAALTDRSPRAIFTAILDPNRDFDSRYANYIAVTKEGLTFSGVLTEETATSVTLKERESKTHLLLRRDLEELRASNKSAMPEGIEKDFSKEDLANLLAYLTQERKPARVFAGNQPVVISPNADGRMDLPASAAEIFGDAIVFETDSPFRNLGYWQGTSDFARWKFMADKRMHVDIYLDYSCDVSYAGNEFAIEIGPERFTGAVVSTGAWSQYDCLKVATVDIQAGLGQLNVGFHKQLAAGQPLFDLRNVFLVPEGSTPPINR
jgi:putative membrane-bound dehydrogenase-like protein